MSTNNKLPDELLSNLEILRKQLNVEFNNKTLKNIKLIIEEYLKSNENERLTDVYKRIGQFEGIFKYSKFQKNSHCFCHVYLKYKFV